MLAIHAKSLKHINKGVTFKKELLNVFKFLAAGFGFKFLILVATVPTGLQTCAKVR